MSGGFGEVVAFLFTFFIITFSVTAVFYSYDTQLNNNVDLINNFEKQAFSSNPNNFEILEPYYSSGRMTFKINNSNINLFKFKDKGIFCFSFIDNSKYVKSDYLFSNIFRPIQNNYNFIEKNKEGLLSVKINFNSSKDNIYKYISCDGQTKIYSILKGKDNWFNSNWNKRKIINITNNANSNIAEYQVEINLNSSNFDFVLGKENEIRFEYPLKESLVLDTTFDNYNQNVKDYSKFNNTIYLGLNSGIETTDPQKNKGIILNGLNFNGINNLISINPNSSLLLNNSLTYSSWIKWNGNGNTFQNIFTNGDWQNALRIVNDGGVNNHKLLFQLNISGNENYLYSNITIDNNWHFITSTYDGSEMKIYLDSILVGNKSIIGNINSISGINNYIGAESSGGYFFNGSIDEVKVFNIDLKENEIKDLFYNNLKFRPLNYYFSNFDGINKKVKVFVKIPAIQSNSNVLVDLYYDNRNGIVSNSNQKNTFSYTTPRRIGYVLSDRISTSTGLSIFSLENNNTIFIDNNKFNLNELQSSTLSKNNINLNSVVKSKYLSQIEGNGDGDDIITPISWASKNFYYRGFRTSGINDRFCIISPFNNSFTEILDNGILIWNGTINQTGICKSFDIPSNDNVAINSSVPILVSYYRTTLQDAFVFYPATNEDLYGIPSSLGFVATGQNGLSLDIYRSFGTLLQSYTLGSYGTASFSGAQAGAAAGHKLVSKNGNLMGAIQQADGDGTESTVFVTKKEMGTKFGSGLGTEYITLVSPYKDANCSTYNNLGNLVNNIQIGTGSNGVYNYSFDTGNSNTYLSPKWEVKCSKPVWGYYEEDINSDETNFFTYSMTRQYIWPEPSYNIT